MNMEVIFIVQRTYGPKKKENPLQAWMFFRPYFHYCLSSARYCEDRFHIHQTRMLEMFKVLHQWQNMTNTLRLSLSKNSSMKVEGREEMLIRGGKEGTSIKLSK